MALLSPPLVPSPLEVFLALTGLAKNISFYRHLSSSIGLVALGYVLSVGLALPLAIGCSRSRAVAGAVLPFHEFVRYVPVAGFVPLLAAVVGIGSETRTAIIFIGTYFQVLFLYIADLSQVPRDLEDSGRTLGLQGSKLIRFVTLPDSLPRLLDSSRVTFAWAWSYLLVAEVISARYGVGFMILQAYRVLRMDLLVALLVVTGVFGLAADAIFRVAKRAACPWCQGNG